jgi:serine/threonine-protein kinase RsbW
MVPNDDSHHDHDRRGSDRHGEHDRHSEHDRRSAHDRHSDRSRSESLDQSDSHARQSVDGDVIELTVPALTGYLGVVRTATAGLAARLSFTLDEIEDLRIAVDEACVMLLSLPGPQPPAVATLTCLFRVHQDTLAVTVSAQVDDLAALPADQSFAWQVLTAHATEVTGRAQHGQAAIDLLKRRRGR